MKPKKPKLAAPTRTRTAKVTYLVEFDESETEQAAQLMSAVADSRNKFHVWLGLPQLHEVDVQVHRDGAAIALTGKVTF